VKINRIFVDLTIEILKSKDLKLGDWRNPSRFILQETELKIPTVFNQEKTTSYRHANYGRNGMGANGEFRQQDRDFFNLRVNKAGKISD
jgi:hypothetical protein